MWRRKKLRPVTTPRIFHCDICSQEAFFIIDYPYFVEQSYYCVPCFILSDIDYDPPALDEGIKISIVGSYTTKELKQMDKLIAHVTNHLVDNMFNDANLLGETLRDFFFAQDSDSEYGCYSTFEVRDHVVELKERPHWIPAEHIEYIEDDHISWHYYKADLGNNWTAYMFYYWDGDGDLSFAIQMDGAVQPTIVENSDCKKSYRWEFVEP